MFIGTSPVNSIQNPKEATKFQDPCMGTFAGLDLFVLDGLDAYIPLKAQNSLCLMQQVNSKPD